MCHPFDLPTLLKGRFIERPNRFLVRCGVNGHGTVDAFLPNPGRLWELLLPGVTLYVTRSVDSGRDADHRRSTQYTVLAVERDDRPILLHTHLTNQVARFLIERRRIPELADASIVRAEYPVGNSRFDFLLRQGRSDIYLEVKSCTLFGNRVAMFPDAVTQRGRRHLRQLASLRKRGLRTCVLFVVHTPQVDWFMPDYHTDLAFSQTLLEVRRKVQVLPVAVEWNSDLSIAPSLKSLEVPWRQLRREVRDRGSYLLLLKLAHEARVDIGSLGRIRFPPGHYVYVGSAMQNLSARVARHARRRKKLHWHVDYLRQAASHVVALPIRSSNRGECDVARAFAGVLGPGPAGFGSSDCHCRAHLFWCPTDPLQLRAFHEVLQHFRLRPPDA
jgi:sugar fermentation stimulation protein A